MHTKFSMCDVRQLSVIISGPTSLFQCCRHALAENSLYKQSQMRRSPGAMENKKFAKSDLSMPSEPVIWVHVIFGFVIAYT